MFRALNEVNKFTCNFFTCLARDKNVTLHYEYFTHTAFLTKFYFLVQPLCEKKEITGVCVIQSSLTKRERKRDREKGCASFYDIFISRTIARLRNRFTATRQKIMNAR